MAPKLLGLGPDPADEFHLFSLNRPGHAGHVVRYAAVHLALEAFDDLRPADLPPLPGGGHFLARIRLENLGKYRVGIGLALVVVGSEGTALVGVEAATDGFNPQLVQHVLVVLFGREGHGRLCIGGCAQQAAGEHDE